LTTDEPQITVVNGVSNFGNINSGALASNSGNPFVISADSLATDGKVVPFNLDLISANGFEQHITHGFVIGVLTTADPFGPDAYGYYCIDNTDVEYMGRPDYAWTNYSSVGTQIYLPDFGNEQDASARLDLPFTFTFYGQDFDTITLCSNGWIAMGNQTYFTDFRNYPLPSALGANSGMVCPFWDNLVMGGGGVYKYYDQTTHRLIIQYNAAHQSGGTEIFQAIFYDPDYYPTPTGDGEIVFMYNTFTNVMGPSSDNDYSTVGIENEDHSLGLQYCYWDVYTPGAAYLANGRAIKFTTLEPVKFPPSTNVNVTLTPSGTIVIPPQGGSFNYTLLVTNTGTSTSVFDFWTMITLPNQTQCGPILLRNNLVLNAGGSISRNMTQVVPAGAPAGTYTYAGYVGNYSATPDIWDQDSFTFSKSGLDGNGDGEWSLIGWDNNTAVLPAPEIPAEFSFMRPSPNPFNPSTQLRYALPKEGYVKLVVFNSLGRLAAELSEGWQPAGWHNVEFNASNLSSGLYFAQIQFNGEVRTQKMLLIK